MEVYTLHFDGSCWPNPGGTAAMGYTLHHGDDLIDSGHSVLGTGPKMSNNVAEYAALNLGLTSAIANIPFGSNVVQVKGDSNLVIKQMSKLWKIKDWTKLYYPYAKRAEELCKEARKRKLILYFDWVPRAKNQECDDLSKAHNIKTP